MSTIEENLHHKINTKTKPVGSLGILENIAFKIGKILNTTSPKLAKPTIIVFAGDHGVVRNKPVSPFPQEVTSQMVLNFLEGGAAINVFCKQNNIILKVVDAGVNYNFPVHPKLINAKINKGTADYSITCAMSKDNCKKAIEKGRKIVTRQFSLGTNIIGFGEMGIGNTSSAALLMSAFTKTPIETCVGKGTGLDNKGVKTKIQILEKVQKVHQSKSSPLEILASFGGYEIAMMTGAFLEARKLGMVILVDGFIATAALLAAHAFENNVLDNCIFTHCSNEQGHKKMLAFLNAEFVLNLGLRLGEGTGAALAYPLIESAVNFLNEMASFESAGVSDKTE